MDRINKVTEAIEKYRALIKQENDIIEQWQHTPDPEARKELETKYMNIDINGARKKIWQAMNKCPNYYTNLPR